MNSAISLPYSVLQGTMSGRSRRPSGSVCAAGNCTHSKRDDLTMFGFPTPDIFLLTEWVNIVLTKKSFGIKEARANPLSEAALANKRDVFRWLHKYAKVDPETLVPLIFSSWKVSDFRTKCKERVQWWEYCGRQEPIGSIWLSELFLCALHFPVCFLMSTSI